MKRFILYCKKGERVLAIIEDAMLVILLLATMLIACTQILLRNGFSSGLSWADPAVNMLVLYLTILGSLVAARENKHLSIDVISKLLPLKYNYIIQRFTHAVSAFICFLMAYYSVPLVKLSIEFNDRAFADLPLWVLQMILPVGFGLMALRFVFNIFTDDISPDADFGIPSDNSLNKEVA